MNRMQRAARSFVRHRDHGAGSEVTTRFAAFQAAANGEFYLLEKQIAQLQERLGQTTRNIQETRAQVAALREQAMNASQPPTTPPAGGVPDTTQRTVASPPAPLRATGSAIRKPISRTAS